MCALIGTYSWIKSISIRIVKLKINIMKTLLKLMFFVACMGVLLGCEKEKDMFVGEDTFELKAAKIKVQPSSKTNAREKAMEDWQNINQALEDAEKGAVVQLGEGTFYLHKSIVCWDFNGTFKGSGMKETTIQTAPGELFDVSECPPVVWTFEKNDGAFMFCFPHNNFEDERTTTVSDLSIIVDEPTTPFYRWKETESITEFNSLHAIMVMNVNTDMDRENPVNMNVVYKNLSVEGEYDAKYLYANYSIFSALSAYGNSNGTFEVKNVNVENAEGCIKPHGFMGADAQIIVKNSHLSSCVRGIYSFLGHSWAIQNNRIENSKNAIAMLGKGGGEPWEGREGSSYVKNNRINFNGGVGIAMQFIKNVEVKNNIIEGIGFGIASMGGENFAIINNNLCGVSPRPIFIGSLINSEIRNNANQIILGPGASHPSIIIGESIECDD